MCMCAPQTSKHTTHVALAIIQNYMYMHVTLATVHNYIYMHVTLATVHNDMYMHVTLATVHTTQHMFTVHVAYWRTHYTRHTNDRVSALLSLVSDALEMVMQLQQVKARGVQEQMRQCTCNRRYMYEHTLQSAPFFVLTIVPNFLLLHLTICSSHTHTHNTVSP